MDSIEDGLVSASESHHGLDTEVRWCWELCDMHPFAMIPL